MSDLENELRDLQVLRRLAERADDPTAWADLHRLCRPLVYARLYRQLKGSELVNDAVQEVFLKLIRRDPFKSVTEPRAFLFYLNAVCRSVAIDVLRHLRGPRSATV